MALSAPRHVFGVHQFTPYRRNDGTPYGTALVLGNSTFSLTGELVELFGGSNKFSWAVEESNITAEISLAVKQIEDWMFELFLGKPTTTAASSATGTVSTLVNKLGSSVVAATGIATVGEITGSESDMKFSKYVVKAVSATTVDVFAKSSVDFNRGTDKEYEDDLLKITASPITIVASTAAAIPDYGVELTGGAGTIAMTIGDTAEFEVFPPHNRTMEVSIGGSSDIFPAFGAIMVAQQRGNGEMFEIDAFNCKGSGLPVGLAEKAFGEPEIAVKAFYDAAKNAVAKFRWVDPS